MAGGMDLGQGGKGGKKPLDTAINLVPFIDLMAVTISFLIMTAVWTQIGRLQVSGGGGDGDPTPDKDDKTVPVTLLLSEKDLRLAVRFKDVKEKLGPDQTAITVQTEDAVRYEDLVHVIDECIGDGFPSVSVAPVST